jgi:hypothetical protein
MKDRIPVSQPPSRPRVGKLPAIRLSFALSVLLLLCAFHQAAAQGTAFTYQGQLNSNGNLANGAYDMRFALFNVGSGGASVTGFLTNSAIPVSNGLFTVSLDFGAGIFNGTTYWLQIGVRSNGTGGFSALSPRQELTPTPYAIFAEGANAGGLSGTIASSNLAGAYGGAIIFTNPANGFAGDGTGLTNVNAAALGGLGAGNFWQLGGNNASGGAFIGTTNNQVMDFRVNNVRAMRFRLTTDATGTFSNAPNVIVGSPLNSISTTIVGGTVSGGGGDDLSGNPYNNNVSANFGTVGGGLANSASGVGSVVAGGGTDGNVVDGVGNSASGVASVVGGGLKNTNLAFYGTIGGGLDNTANSSSSGFLFGGSTVAGGAANKASTDFATVGGGLFNAASGVAATVPGGSENIAAGLGSFAAGQDAQTTHDGTFIWGDGSEIPFTGAGVDNTFNVLASGGVFLYDGTNGVHIDSLGNNDGSLDFGLKFGGALSSGEGVASKRTSGGNQYGLDFYTSSANRMSIAGNGFVGINTTSPSQRLEVNGNYVLIDGHNADDGNGPIDAYIGGDGGGSDVQIGSMNTNITAVGFWNYTAGAWMHIGCSSITIHGGADLAEPFPMVAANEIQPGAVLVIDRQHPGQLKLSDQAYDGRVAGVVSGANGINPGIQMSQQGILEGGKNVALTGRVYVQADASNGAIEPGDLLTTSSFPGHAMKVTDHARAQGAILGKAMTGLSEGEGMVLVLVSLQ